MDEHHRRIVEREFPSVIPLFRDPEISAILDEAAQRFDAPQDDWMTVSEFERRIKATSWWARLSE